VGRLLNPPEDVPFLEIVNEAIERLRGRLDAIHAVVEIQRDLPIVRGDRTRLIEVVQNLVDNAAKYARPEERAQIQIGVSGINDDGYAIFFVRDNGIGIEPQYHERIFGLFNKLDPNTEGTGIGLSLVKRIVETHNGHIWVESEKGKGSTFRFSLPVPAAKE
jgi:signal transduction histidine kinase